MELEAETDMTNSNGAMTKLSRSKFEPSTKMRVPSERRFDLEETRSRFVQHNKTIPKFEVEWTKRSLPVTEKHLMVAFQK